jgi:flavin reductase (DIM6/NTAB) family NADH-FMN oxidoreductase RutF
METTVRRATLRKLSNGVYVLTARAADRYGAATVSWVSQASFRPPLIMAAVRRQNTVFGCLVEGGAAALHIVAADQLELARRFFATTVARAGTINGEPFTAGTTSAPVLCSAPACIECSVEQVVETGGDHAVVILRVVAARCSGGFRPLTIADSPWEYGG